MKLNSVRNTFIVAVAAIVAAVASPAGAGEGALAFRDAMDELGLSDPGYGWHSYHDTIVCADWDNDGDTDILVVTSLHEKSELGAQGRLYVNLLAESGALAFEDRTETLLPEGIGKKMIADGAPFFFDVNNDGRLDICSITDEGKPCTYINEGDKFRLEEWGFVAQNCTIKDINGDGLLDVLGNDTGTVYTNEGDGKFSGGKAEGSLSGHMPRDKVLPVPEGIEVDEEAKTQAAAEGHVYYYWHKVDINGDGREDWQLSLSQAYGFKLLRFYAREGEGWRDVTAETGLPTTVEVEFIELTGDGKPDAVASGPKVGGIFLGDGKGHFTAAPESDANKVFSTTIGGCYTAAQAVIDFNNDGVLDILTYEPRVGTASAILRGLGEGRYENIVSTGAGSGQAAADFNGDGLLDVVASGASDSKGLHVWLNSSAEAGKRLDVTVRDTGGNPFAVGARVEAFEAGRIGDAEALIADGTAERNGLPVHLGLGNREKVDLRVTLSRGAVKETAGAETGRRMEVRFGE